MTAGNDPLARLVETLWAAGRAAEAELVCRQALELEPGHPRALGWLAEILTATDRGSEALALLERLVGARPDDPSAARRLGTALLGAGEARAACAVLERAVELEPGNPRGHNNLGEALLQSGDAERALASYDRALVIDSHYAVAHNNRGLALQRLGRRDEALSSFVRAAELAPAMLQPQVNMASLLRSRGELPQALQCYDRALAIDATFLQAWSGKAELALAAGNPREGLACAERALALRPDHAFALVCRARALRLLGVPEARRALEAAVAALPGNADALAELGLLLGSQGEWEAARRCFEQVTALDPEYPHASGYRLYLALCCAEWSGYDALLDTVVQGILRGRRACSPFVALLTVDSPVLQRKCAETQVAEFGPTRAGPATHRVRQPRGRARIGYLSADLHEHPTAYLMAELFETHDRSQFDYFALSIGPAVDDAMARRIGRAFGAVERLHGRSDQECARRIADLGIDLLVDLKGHTLHARPGILALRPAPVQINYLGYPGTMGAPFVDYLIADRHVIPPGDRRHFSESIVYLPTCYQVNGRQEISPRTPTRAECGLPEHGFVFCCFNNIQKLTPPVFDRWMRILVETEGGVLWLLAPDGIAAGNLREHAVARGVAPDRLVFAPPLPHADHLARYRLADLFLDTLPYNAHTTASDALRMGCPVLTATGTTFAGRVATSLLHAVGAVELVTRDLAHYERRAIELARSPAVFGPIRAKVRAAPKSALFDTDRTRRALEGAYRGMWDRYLAGEQAESFSVEEGLPADPPAA